jgi:catechol 2,3-dioxygenase-like lactoylglutathione lyase family enzyme
MGAVQSGAELDRAEAAAMVAGACGALATLWSAQLRITPPGGPAVDRSTALDLVEQGILAYRRVDREVEHVLDQGDVLVSIGREDVVPTSGEPSSRRYTHVWAREDDTWRLVARHASTLPQPSAGVTHIQHAKVPVTDLVHSLAWYRDLLGLEWTHEFSEDGSVRGVSLLHRVGGFSIALREREAIPSRPDLRGFDPFAIGVARRADLDAIADRCDDLGVPRSAIQEREDGAVLDVPDPDGTVVRFYHLTELLGFVGLDFRDGAAPEHYDAPRLVVPPMPVPHGREAVP